VVAAVSSDHEFRLWEHFAYEGFSRLIPRNVLIRARNLFSRGKKCSLTPYQFMQHRVFIERQEEASPDIIAMKEMALLELIRAYHSIVPVWSATELEMYDLVFQDLLGSGRFGVLEAFIALFPGAKLRWIDFNTIHLFYENMMDASQYTQKPSSFEQWMRLESDEQWREFMLEGANRLRRLLRALLGRAPTLADVPNASDLYASEDDGLHSWERYILDASVINNHGLLVLVWTAYGECDEGDCDGGDVLTQLKTRPPFLRLEVRDRIRVELRHTFPEFGGGRRFLLTNYLFDVTAIA